VSSYATAPIERVCEPHAVVRYVPVGVIALITPWNNPIAIPIGKIAPALLYGNTVVWKPSPAATSVAHRLFELLTRAGCPEGVLNIVSGDASTAEILMKEESIEAVTLSGSLLAGRAAYYTCTNRLIPYQGELGGNNASIVWPDCDLKNAAELITEGAFGFSGQRCTANRRVIVHADCYDEFIELASATVQQMQAGDPFLIETQIGPLISTESRKRVAGVVDGAAQKGFLQLQPGVLKMGEYDTEAFHDPVIVCCDKPLDEVVQDETFGPLMVIQKTDSWENAIELCNGVKQGLAASVFSESAEIQEHFLQDARAGILKINRATSDAGVNVPFGGWKHSGVGPPEHGPSNREFYTRTQSIYR
jgi:alpha-ketoglutaric semialdehyde dehydrogenase